MSICDFIRSYSHCSSFGIDVEFDGSSSVYFINVVDYNGIKPSNVAFVFHLNIKSDIDNLFLDKLNKIITNVRFQPVENFHYRIDSGSTEWDQMLELIKEKKQYESL